MGAPGRAAEEEGRALGHGSHVLATRRPLKHFHEQVACMKVAKVGRRFGPLVGRIGSWAQNEVCLSRRALNLSLKVLSHWINRLRAN